MRTGDGFLCVYSVTLQASFDEAVNLHEHILRVKDAEEVPFVLVGNKCDLEDAREVKTEKGQGMILLSLLAKFGSDFPVRVFEFI